ncbi:hypothetical protein GQ53DRAFT_880474 [Thozetella sp. PMI_491]|nr:hypothetical protein GQ53DRAFT_880474 [Thozetella sp. PMI_491]
MARSRVPAGYAVIQLFFRLISASLCTSLFITACYISSKGHGVPMIGVFIASIWTLTVDIPEIVGLLDAKRQAKRCVEGCLIALEIFTSLLCTIVVVVTLFMALGNYRSFGDNVGFAGSLASWIFPTVIG